MNDQTVSHAHKIDKKQISAMATFVMTNVPKTDEYTLKKFLELMNTTGLYGTITWTQLRQTIQLTKKYVPNTCDYSLNVLIDLLGVYFPLEGEMDRNDDGEARPNRVDSPGSNNGSQGTAAFKNGRHSHEQQGMLQSKSHR